MSKNYFYARAFSSYSSRNLILEKSVLQNVYDEARWYVSFSGEAEYLSNFGQNCGSCSNIGTMPFWSGTNQLTVGNNDGRAQLDAYQFGMGNVDVDENGIAGVIQLNPKISQIGADFLFYVTEYVDKRGAYFKLDLPLGAMRINPQFKELKVAKPDEAVGFTQTTADPDSSEITFLLTAYPSPGNRPLTITQAFQGDPTNLNELLGYAPTDITILKGKVPPCCTQTAIALSDLSVVIGYNVYGTEQTLVGAGFKVSMPTGNVPTADYMLEPVFGRGGAWGVGLDLMGHHELWYNNAAQHDTPKRVEFWFQGEAMHLIPGRAPNFRSFDLKKNGPGSKYLLVQRYTENYELADPVDLMITGNSLQPAINLTTLPVVSKIAIEGSLAVMIDAHYKNWNVGIGGEVWGRSGECLQINECSELYTCVKHNLNQYAVVGRQLESYYIEGQGNLDTFYAEPAATISKSQDPVTLVGSTATVTAPATLPSGIVDARLPQNRIPGNFYEALDITGAQAASVCTGKIFGQIGYSFNDPGLSATVSLVGGAEFVGNTNNAAQLWSVGIQGSVNY